MPLQTVESIDVGSVGRGDVSAIVALVADDVQWEAWTRQLRPIPAYARHS